jgi:hypothetical protein
MITRESQFAFFTFLRAAAAEMEHAFTPARFVELRYNKLSRLAPHEVWGVEHAEGSFFATTLAYLTHERPIPELRPGSKADDDQTYWRRYTVWLRQWQSLKM